MVRVLLAFLIACSAAAEVRFAPEQHVAPPRMGFTSNLSTSYPITVTEGDGQFLVTWADIRSENPVSIPWANGTPIPHAALAMRVDASGRALDEHPIPLPFYVAQAVWTGTDWIVLNGPAAHVSRDGVVSGISQPLTTYPFVDGTPPDTDSAWTGKALVMAVKDSSAQKLIVRTFDEQFRLIDDRVVLEGDQGGTVVGVASDGLTAIVVYRRQWWGSERTQFSVFNRDGYLISHGMLPEGTYYDTVAAGGSGYMITGPRPSWLQLQQGVIVDSGGSVTHTVSPFLIYTHAIWSGPSLYWDGTGYTMLAAGHGELGDTHFQSVRFDAAGTLLGAPTELKKFSYGKSPTTPVMTMSGTTVATAMRAGAAFGGSNTYPLLQVRVAPDPSMLFNVAPTPMPPAATPRETPAAASNANAVLAAWRERTSSTSELEVAATFLRPDGTPTGNTFSLGGSSCNGIAPAVATDGRDFLVAYTTATNVYAALVRADGSVKPASRVGGSLDCTAGGVRLASNGSQYLAVWPVVDGTYHLQIYGARIAADGTLLDLNPFIIAAPAYLNAKTTVFVASNGTDYLVACDNFAARVTAAGKVLDFPTPLPLGTGSAASAWFNGRTYVVAMAEGYRYRFYRIGADGSGAHSWSAPAPPSVILGTNALSAVPACDANGCFALNGRSLIRIADLGTSFAVTTEPANVDTNAMVHPALVFGSRLLLLYSRNDDDAPYVHAPAVFVRGVAGGKQRAARH